MIFFSCYFKTYKLSENVAVFFLCRHSLHIADFYLLYTLFVFEGLLFLAFYTLVVKMREVSIIII